MSQNLITELNKVAKKVNEMIDRIISRESEPRVLYRASRHLVDAGGKRLRPFLALKTCEMVGGRMEDALPTAAAIELLHNFTLIHDDIMDRDDKRRGKETVHVLWGVPMAITAGDLLFAKVYDAILHHTDPHLVPLERILRVFDVITEAAIAICEGQALDMLFGERETVTEDEYMRMIGGKTAALYKASAQAGAIVGGGTGAEVERLGNYAFFGGLAFQITDDVLGLTADERVLGKPVGSDVREGKRTIIMVHALSHSSPEERRFILSILGNRESSLEAIRKVTELVQSLGSIDYALQRAGEYLQRAKDQLSPFPETPTKELLLELSDFLVAREY